MQRTTKHVSGTSKVNRFNYDDYIRWYKLRYEEGLPALEIANKYCCSYQHVRKMTKEINDGG